MSNLLIFSPLLAFTILFILYACIRLCAYHMIAWRLFSCAGSLLYLVILAFLSYACTYLLDTIQWSCYAYVASILLFWSLAWALSCVLLIYMHASMFVSFIIYTSMCRIYLNFPMCSLCMLDCLSAFTLYTSMCRTCWDYCHMLGGSYMFMYALLLACTSPSTWLSLLDHFHIVHMYSLVMYQDLCK